MHVTSSIEKQPRAKRAPDRRRAPEPFPLSRRDRARLPIRREVPGILLLGLLIAATALAAVLRLLVNRDLSLPEIRQLNAVRAPFGTLIAHLIHGGVTPPLDPVLTWCAVHLVGHGALAVRLPSLIAGVLVVPAAAWFARELFDRETAVVVAILCAIAPILVWYSQEVSGYALVVLFGTLTFTGAARVVRRGEPRDWALFTAAAAAAVWSDWSGLFVLIAGELMIVLSLLTRRGAVPAGHAARSWVLATLALIGQLVPLGLMFAAQLRYSGGLSGVTGVASSGLTFYSAVSNGAWLLFGFHATVVTSVLSAVWPLAMLGTLMLIGRNLSAAAWMLLVCAWVPTLGVFLLGAVVPSAFDVRYGVAAAVPILVLLGRVAINWIPSRSGRIIMLGLLGLVLAVSLVDQQLDPSNPRRFDYVQALDQLRREAPSGSVVLYEPAQLAPVFAHDAPGLRVHPLSHHLPTPRAARDVFVLTSGVAGEEPLIALRNREIGALTATRHLISHRVFPGVDLWWFR